MGKDYLYRSRGSASRFRKILIAVTLVWGALLCLQFGLGYVLVTYQVTSPTNGLLMAIGAATLVITAFTWSGVVGRSMLSSVFIYRNRVSLRYRNQPARVFHFTKDAEFRLYRFPLLRKAHLRIREKGGTAVQWMSIGDAPVLVKAFREAALPLSENWTRYPAVLFLFWGSFAASVVFDRPIAVWLAGGALFSWLYSIGFFQKPPL